MTNIAKGIYRFTDTKTGEVFEGTRDEYAEHLKIKERALDTRIQNRRVAREKIGEIKIKQKKRIQRYTNFKTGQVFEGSRKEACEFFEIKDWKLAIMLRERSIISEPIVDNEIQEDISELPKSKSKEEKIRRELFRIECRLKSL
ncbi:hypothetical protein KJR36_03605 [Streptococcus infantarius subsp. infantarius]|uniref:hypothetical protein n=1 Tax=Streptococcus infantarius TaxID=102684 RepID=UPI001BDAE563|nr:hypothetical protein [Streptococcus infantarius]MBT0903775.1 hypothetical protein [Streptococcus infantarius subsp. infantarius]MBT0917688.1 hypothetical protein [Streptococcus infantarius subsp. infantarius]